MNLHHGLFHLALHQHVSRFHRAGNALLNEVALLGHGFFEHPVDHLSFHARVAYADAQAPIIAGAQLGVNIAKTIVASMAASKFEFGFTGHDIKLVMGHQYFLRCNFEELGQSAHRLAREVHESLGF